MSLSQQLGARADGDVGVGRRLLQVHVRARLEHQELEEPAAGLAARLAARDLSKAQLIGGPRRAAAGRQPPLLLARRAARKALLPVCLWTFVPPFDACGAGTCAKVKRTQQRASLLASTALKVKLRQPMVQLNSHRTGSKPYVL